MTTPHFFRPWPAILVAAALNAGPASGQGADRAFDCLIEPAAVVRVASPAVGVIEEVLVSAGDAVETGEVIARLRADVERANLRMARARAENHVEVDLRRERAALARRKYDRAAELSQREVLAGAALDESETEARMAEMAVAEAAFQRELAGLELARAEAVLEQKVIRSPFDAIVTEQMLRPGEYAHEQAQVVTLAQLDPLDVRVFVPIDLYGAIRPGQAATVRPEAPVGGAHQARVETVDRVFDAASGTFGVRLRLPNPDSALPAGLRCVVEFAQARP